MKRMTAFLLAGALCLGLTGCGETALPEKAADGADWDESWVTVGGVVGVDTPEGIDPREKNEALAVNGMYYATWSVGEGEPYTNAEGKEAQIYDVYLYLILSSQRSAEDAESTLKQWTDMAGSQYAVDSTAARTCNGQEFTIMTYSFDSGNNPYARGASAFGVYQSYAVSVELTCREGYDDDAAELLGRFLDSCHYAAQ